MANPEHLAKLKEGVEAWNQWREEDPNIVPDLDSANLRNANLNGAHLESANLMDANLIGAHLESANLMDANLMGAYLDHARLRNANLKYVLLNSGRLYHSQLKGSKLKGAHLYDVLLNGANLENSTLINANLTDAQLNFSRLNGANLNGANLKDSTLIDANFTGAHLNSVNFKRVAALGTNFEEAILTGACIMDWNINSQTNLQNVQCDYIYLKAIYSEEEKKYIFTNRVPHDPDRIFAPGEFTKRYQKILETVNLFFGEGIDWQVFLNSFQKLQEEEKIKIADGEIEIPIVQGIENTGDGSFVIKIGISPDTDKGEIEKSFWQKYQRMLEAAEEKYRSQLNFKDEQIQFYRQNYTQVLDIIKLTASQPIKVIQKQGDNQVTENRDITIEQGNYNENIQGDYYEQKGNFGIGHMSGGTITGNAKVAAIINESAQQDLNTAATEIKQLLDQLAQTYPTKTIPEQMVLGAKAIEKIEKDSTLKQRIINALKAMTVEAFTEAINHPLANVLRAGIEAYREPQ